MAMKILLQYARSSRQREVICILHSFVPPGLILVNWGQKDAGAQFLAVVRRP